VTSSHQQEQTFQDYIRLLNVSSLEEARNVSTAKLQLANAITVGLAIYGGFTYGPVVDGDFTPALPGQLLARGKFDKEVKVMVGHNANEVSAIATLFSQSLNRSLTFNRVSCLLRHTSTTAPTSRNRSQPLSHPSVPTQRPSTTLPLPCTLPSSMAAKLKATLITSTVSLLWSPS
jgi:carboxylesterase type B